MIIKQTLYSPSPAQLSQRLKMVNGVFVPAELTTEILVRLPVKSLLRMRCVCKLWCQIISDSSFIESHHRRSRTRSNGNFLLSIDLDGNHNNRKKDVSSITMYPWEGEDSNGFTQHFTSYSSEYLLESINGLICLTGPPTRICNLSTRESVILPEPSTLGFLASCCWLGYDPSSNRYKILKKMIFNEPYYVKFEVLTVGSDSWREVVDVNYSYNRVVEVWRRSVCVGGSLYWDALGVLKGILAFDLVEERFRVVPPPPPPPASPYNSSLARIKGRLAVVDYSYLISEKKIMRIWMMLEDDKNGGVIWSIEQRIVFPSLKPAMSGYLVTTIDGEFIIVSESIYRDENYINVSCYHLESGEFRVKSFTKPGGALNPSVINYVESMVSLTQIINSDKCSHSSLNS